MKQHQSGFAAVELLLTLILLAIIGFTGYYVWHSQQQAENALNDANDTAQTSSPKQSKSATPPQKFLTIKEWGVKIPLVNAIADATYSLNASNSNDAIVQLPGYAAKCDVDDPFGYYMRFSKSDTFEDGTTYLSTLGSSAIHVGDYYYIHQGPQAACSNDDATNSQVTADVQLFKAATAGIKANDN